MPKVGVGTPFHSIPDSRKKGPKSSSQLTVYLTNYSKYFWEVTLSPGSFRIKEYQERPALAEYTATLK